MLVNIAMMCWVDDDIINTYLVQFIQSYARVPMFEDRIHIICVFVFLQKKNIFILISIYAQQGAYVHGEYWGLPVLPVT